MIRPVALILVSLLCILEAPALAAPERGQQQQRMMKIGDEVVRAEIGREFVRAQGLISSGNYKQAETVLKTIVEQSPNTIAIQYKYGFVLLQLSKFDEALAQAKQCVEIAPNFVGGWSLLGEASMELHQDDQARDAYKKALALEPKGENADIIREHLDELENPPQPQPTVEEVGQSEKMDQKNKDAMRVNRALGLCQSATRLFGQKQFAQGMQQCREALAMAPENDQIKENFVIYVNNYAANCVQNQRLKQAEALMREAIAVQDTGGVTGRSQLTTLKNYSALLNFLGRTAEAQQLERQMKGVVSTVQ